jgi:hypothetical protein
MEFAMNLHTLSYLPESSSEMADPMIGLPDLRKGLNTILMGYLLSLGAVLAACGVIGYLIFQAGGAPLSRKAAEQASTVLFAVVILLALAGIGSLILIVRGKWMCLSSAPELFHAKWMMFMSILCVLAGPALNTGAFLVGESKADARGRASNQTSATLLHELDQYKHGMPDLDTRSYVKLAGQAIGLLSGVFFVLFLRAVALGWGAQGRARFAELYLLFLALLVAGVVALLWKPSFMLARPLLLLGLAGGWLIAALWYFVLILSMVAGISNILAQRSRA